MSEVKHTPGPWTIHEKGRHPYPYVCGPSVEMEHGEDRYVIAYFVGPNIDGNASLVVAAPDLLKSLVKAHNTLSGLGYGGIADNICSNAIAKATGEA